MPTPYDKPLDQYQAVLLGEPGIARFKSQDGKFNNEPDKEGMTAGLYVATIGDAKAMTAFSVAGGRFDGQTDKMGWTAEDYADYWGPASKSAYAAATKDQRSVPPAPAEKASAPHVSFPMLGDLARRTAAAAAAFAQNRTQIVTPRVATPPVPVRRMGHAI